MIPKFRPNTKVYCKVDNTYNTIIGIIKSEDDDPKYLLSKDSFYYRIYDNDGNKITSIDCWYLDMHYEYHSTIINYNKIWMKIINGQQ